MEGAKTAMPLTKKQLTLSLLSAVFTAGLGIGLAVVPSLTAQTTGAAKQAPEQLSPGAFAELQALIRPHLGESSWAQLPWETSLWRARQKAAAQGKPIFFMLAGGGSPLGFC
jgi:hypothetical protein